MYRTAIIGCGRIGSMLEDDPLRAKPATHAGGFSAHRSARIVAGCDINEQRLKLFGEKYRIDEKYLYTDYKKMLAEVKPDIVSVATWTELHAEMVVACAKAPSTKGIYCEKPIANTLKDADRMINACRKRRIPLVIGHERRFDLNFVKVKEMIDKGTLGALRAIYAHTLSQKVPRLPVEKYTGGSLFHDGTHLFDLILYFGGSARSVTGFDMREFGRRHIEHTAYGIVHLANGVPVFFEGGGRREYFKFDLDLHFEKGRICIGNSGIALFGSTRSRHYTGFRELEPLPYQQPKRWRNSFIGAADELIKSIRSGRRPISSGEDARDALEILLAVYRSARSGGKEIKIARGRKRGT